MASYTVANGQIGAHAKVLGAGVVDTVTFALGNVNTPGWGVMPEEIEVLTDGVADIYVTLDGTAPTVGGSNCHRVPARAGASAFSMARPAQPAPVVVKLISVGAPTYSVCGT